MGRGGRGGGDDGEMGGGWVGGLVEEGDERWEEKMKQFQQVVPNVSPANDVSSSAQAACRGSRRLPPPKIAAIMAASGQQQTALYAQPTICSTLSRRYALFTADDMPGFFCFAAVCIKMRALVPEYPDRYPKRTSPVTAAGCSHNAGH